MVDTRAKPRNRLERLRRRVEDVRNKTFNYEPRPKKKIDWARYTDAQIYEHHDTLVLLMHTIEAISEPTPRSGRGRHPVDTAKDRAKVLALKHYFGVGNRGAQGLALLFKEKLRLEKTPHYKAIERAHSDPRVQAVITEAFATTAKHGARNATAFSLDGSGLPTSMKQNWESQKNSKEAKRFDGSITILALPSQLILAHHDLPIGFMPEAPHLPILVERTVMMTGPLDGRIVCADAGFISRRNCDAITNAGGTPRIFPKRNLSTKSLGSPGWAPMLGGFLRNTQTWLHEYHQRSLSETGWSTFKRLFPRPLRTRLATRRPCERRTRFLVYNLVRLTRLNRQHQLGHHLPTN